MKLDEGSKAKVFTIGQKSPSEIVPVKVANATEILFEAFEYFLLKN